MFKRDVFGHLIFLRRILVSLIGIFSFSRLNWRNRTIISGTENLDGLPQSNVLFVSNHQTYFADVMAIMHTFCSHTAGFKNSIRNPSYLLWPRVNTYFVAAEETMKSGILPKIFAYAGSVSIKRTFRHAGQDVNRKVEMKDISNIGKALSDGWVITFPQGTTTPFAKGRRGTVHIIRKFNPVVVPVVISGFNVAFDKRGLKNKKRGVNLTVSFKPPLDIRNNMDAEQILGLIMDSIEQSDRFRK